MKLSRRQPRGIKIGHASISENGDSGRNGKSKAGNQTGKELCFRSWYSKNWKFVLRCRDSSIADKMAKACEDAVSNPNIGYDQSQRNTLNTQAKLVGYELSRIKTPCECDCSSLMAVCAQAAGISITYSSGNAPTTSTMERAFSATGMFDVLRDDTYTKTDAYLKRGDILVAPGSHTVMALESGNPEHYPTLKRGSKGEYVRRLQSKLVTKGYKIKVDGIFGDETKTALVKYQTEVFPDRPLEWDGICGIKTWTKLNN